MMPAKSTPVERRSFLRGRQELGMLPNRQLAIAYERLLARRQFQIPLWQISPSPERRQHLSVGYLAIMSMFLVFSLVGIMRVLEGVDLGVFLGLGGWFLGCFSIAFACLWELQNAARSRSVYHLRQGGQIHVWFTAPEAKAVQVSGEAVTTKAGGASQDGPAISPLSLAGEITAFKQSVDSGSLTEGEDHRAKEKPINSAEVRKLGSDNFS